MTIEEKVKELILARHGTLKNFAPLTGLSYSTVDTVLRRGIHKSSVSSIIAICKALGISADGLAKDEIVPAGSDSIQVMDIDHIKHYIQSLAIDGQMLSEEEKDFMTDILDISVEMIRRKR